MNDRDYSKYDVGVIVGRFQLADIHEAHEFLVDTVVNNHKKMIILLGVPRAIGTPENPIRIPSRENPLDFLSRQYMMQEKYPNAIVTSIQDKDSDEQWSEMVDTKIREHFPTETVLLYGGRDSFIPHYKGIFDVEALDPEIYVSATEMRNSISKEVLKSRDFRRGQIYYAYQQTPVLYTNYKIAVTEDDKILFCNDLTKKNQKMVLLSGLAGINDASIEIGAKRVLGNMLGGLNVDVHYETSKSNMEFGNKTNRVMNILVSAKKLWGRVTPNGNFSTQWISIDELLTEGYMVKHIEKDDFEYVQHMVSKMRKDK